LEVDAEKLLRTSALLTEFPAVAWTLWDFPDNSVVCHANRRSGGAQDCFPGSGFLGVDCGLPPAFFPAVYNEDWLFLFDYLRDGRFAIGGKVGQLTFDPFCPDRARSEEYGDVLAEGLFRSLHLGLGDSALLDVTYWQEVQRRRAAFIDDVARRLDAGSARQPDAREPAIRSCLDAALQVHEASWPRSLVSFIRLWQADKRRWNEYWERLPQLANIAPALRRLGLATPATPKLAS
jgi:hypothetical protein